MKSHRCKVPSACAMCIMRRSVARMLGALAATKAPELARVPLTMVPYRGQPHVCGAECPRPCPSRSRPWVRP